MTVPSTILKRLLLGHPTWVCGRRNLSTKDQKALAILEDLYKEVCGQRFKDVVVIDTKNNANPRYLILASAFNSRHLTNGTQALNKYYKTAIKTDEENFAKISVAPEWNVIDYDYVIVHLFSKKCREHFDVEQLWAVGEEFDNLVQN